MSLQDAYDSGEEFTRKAKCPMPSREILQEVERLHGVSDRLDALAEQHPTVSDGLVKISRSVRNTATLLEVMVLIKIGPLPGDLDLADA